MTELVVLSEATLTPHLSLGIVLFSTPYGHTIQRHSLGGVTGAPSLVDFRG
jgi:hypothetical protein